MQNIGKYHVIRILGRGGMGTVYEALDPVINRRLAIKTMSPGFAENPELKARFLREAQAAGGLHHRNIVTVYDLGEDDGQPYIAMELIEGTDLDKVIQSRSPLSVERKLDILRQVCAGLAKAHRNGIVHRDVKPPNIRLTPEGDVKIMDFGIAHLQASNLTGSGLVLGTVHYMSPEQIQGKKLDQRADIFSVGAVAFELLSYRRPFPGESLTEIMYKVTHEGADATRLPHTAYSPRLEAIVMKALEADRDRRYASLDEMLAELDGLGGTESLSGAVGATLGGQTEGARVPAGGDRVDEKVAARRAEVDQALADGQLQRALGLCQALLGEDPSDPWALARDVQIRDGIQNREVEQLAAMALSYAAAGDEELAEKIATRIQGMAPASPRYLELRRYLDDAEQRRTAETLVESAREHLVHGNLEEAHALVEEALQIDADNAAAKEIRERTGRVLESRGARQPAAQADDSAPIGDAPTVAMDRIDIPSAPPPAPAVSSPASREPETAVLGVPEAPPPVAPTPPAPAVVAAPLAPVESRRAEVEGLNTKALNYFVGNKYAQASQVLERVLAIDPKNKKAQELKKILSSLG